ncbi:hypothetical protein MJ575_09155 [Klebsiella pneumoniae]|nr:hypothetical protein MJ575_09155 [Klebsiella pneumoniae]
MAVIDPAKLVIENHLVAKSEMVVMPNHPNKPEMGSRSAVQRRNLDRSRGLPRRSQQTASVRAG